MTITFNRCWVN